MATAEKFIVLPFKRNRAGIVPGEMRQASTAGSAEKIAGAMASRHLGVAAYAIMVDEESGDMTAPRLLVSHGEISDITTN